MIYPQSITGKFRTIKDYSSYLLLLIYFGCSWIRWNRGEGVPSQAILMDLPGRKAYLFGFEIWPDEAYYIAGLLILGAMGLFFVTSLWGRIWCGYTCPHTVFVELFVKAERLILGDRNERMRFDKLPSSPEKLKKIIQVRLLWLAISFSFAFGWVCYFYDAPTLVKDIFNFRVTAGGLAWLAGLTASTYLFAGYIREKVCIYMCPYGRFQSAMLDNNTSIVSYRHFRGEPRGKYNPKDKSLGDCIDCGKCVVVCPMGIDIRNGLQLACIGCGLCIDACNSVMEKIGREPYLIAYDNANSFNHLMSGQKYIKKYFSTKTVIFGLIFCIVSGALLYSLTNKPDYKINIAHDRSALFTYLPDGSIRNGYEIKINNKTHKDITYQIKVENVPSAQIKLQGISEYQEVQSITVPAASEESVFFFVKIKNDQNLNANINLMLVLINDNNTLIKVGTKFITGKNA